MRWIRSRWLLVALALSGLVALMVQWQQSGLRRQQLDLAARCQHAYHDGDWPRLEELARQWAGIEPHAASPWLYAAQAARAMDQPQLAADYLQKIQHQPPLEALLDLSQLQMEQLVQPEAAYQTCLKTAELYPGDPENHQRLLFYYSMTCQPTQIVAEVSRALRTGADTPVTYAYRLGAYWLTYRNGFDMNAMWLNRHPDSELYDVASVVHLVSNQSLSQLAQQDSSADKPLLPMEYFDKQLADALQRYPNNVQLQATRLARLCQAGNVAEVALALNAASAETAEDHRFWRFKGWYHAAREQWPESISSYEHALELEPLDWMTQHELSTALRRSDRATQAVSMQRRANLGKELMRTITFAPRIDALDAQTLDKMSDYFRQCEQPLLAERLEKVRRQRRR